METFKSYFGLFIYLQKEKNSKNKKTSRQDNFNFLVFFHIQPYLIFEKCIWNNFHIKFEDLKPILDFWFAYKKKKVQNLRKTITPGQFQIFCLFWRLILFNIWNLHLESFSYQMWRFKSYFGLFICSQN